MELVEFMSNKECVVETFKVNGLIAKDNTVTEKGLMSINRNGQNMHKMIH